MIGYHFDLSCPRCGSEMEHVADGRPQGSTTTQAHCRCRSCGATWLVRVDMLATYLPSLAERARHNRLAAVAS